jgi:hypothetical protein
MRRLLQLLFLFIIERSEMMFKNGIQKFPGRDFSSNVRKIYTFSNEVIN